MSAGEPITRRSGEGTALLSEGMVWDLLVIGGGTAGLVGARTAAALGASVLLVERARTGGDCLWTGCVPSKAFLAAANAAAGARAAARFGVHAAPVRVDFAEVMEHVRSAIRAVEPADSPESLRAAGVAVVHGQVRFTGSHTALVDDAPARFRQALIATGSQPLLPDIPGLAGVSPLTSDTVWELTALPERLVVLGGGSVGCELGQALSRLGSRVTIIEAAERLLGAEDPDASRLVTAALAEDGATVLAGNPATAVEVDTVVLGDGRRVGFDAVLVALGRSADTSGLDVSAAGVEVDEQGFVLVDEHLRTTNLRVWAAGDVTGHAQLTHVAGVHAATAVTNAVLGLRRRAETTTVPRVTFTDPELASVGLGSGAPGVSARTVKHEEVDRAITEKRPHGYTRLILGRKGRIVGASIVGPRAGETLAELTLAIARGVTASELAGVIHPYPTWADGQWSAAIAEVQAGLAAPATRRAIRALAATRRRWLDLRG